MTYEDTWGLDVTLSKIIAKHLRAFLAASKGPYGGTPGELCTRFGDRAHQEWHNIIRKMIYAFEEYERSKFPIVDLFAEEEEDMDEEVLKMEEQQRKEQAEDRQRRVKEGMQLFIDYYEHLWI